MANKIISKIPNTITSLNLLSGCVATVMAFKANETIGCLAGWQWTCVFIALATVFDYLDGASARLLKAYSEIGRELDSLSDLVSFGVAPAMLIFNLMNNILGESILNYIALFIPVMGALRLARFNVMDAGSTIFRGLPIPANAIFWMGVAGWMNNHSDAVSEGVLIPAIIIVSLMMVSDIKMFSLKFKNFKLAENFRRFVIIIAAIFFVVFYGLEGLVWTIVLYFLISILTRQREQ